ncbi:DUF2911 domain-containing protein [Neptunitalea chrysea]|nr:DUF2911 domain-containing protein [Neptunitalea chrysea]
MKNITLAIICAFVGFMSYAQIKTPQASPGAKIEQTIGLTEVTVTYSRPSMKGREIFGDLVPYDKIWRTGANANTVITFSENVFFGNTEVEKGSYAIYTKPGKKSWEMYLYADTNNWGAPRDFDMEKVVAKATAEVMEVPFQVETFTIDFNNLRNSGADLEMIWSNVYVAFPIKTMTKEQTVNNIKKVMSGPSSRDYYSAAVFYYTENMEMKKAVEMIDKAIEMEGDKAAFYMYRQQSLIHDKAGDRKGAIKAARISLQKSKEVGNQDYVKMNEDTLREWKAL